MSALYDALAAYRLTKLVTSDTLLAKPREWAVQATYLQAQPERVAEAMQGMDPDCPTAWADYAMGDERAPKLATLVTCRWCAGAWISLGVVAARRYCPKLWAPLARALAYSAGAALLARLEDD